MRDWNKEIEKRMQGCFDCIDWSVLCDASGEVDLNVNVLSSYISFCFDMIAPTREVRTYPNNIPWITKDIKLLINEKKHLINSHDRVQLKVLQKKINEKIAAGKKRYKSKVESLFSANKSKDAWKGLKILCSSKTKNVAVEPDNVETYVNDLNKFYARFVTLKRNVNN